MPYLLCQAIFSHNYLEVPNMSHGSIPCLPCHRPGGIRQQFKAVLPMVESIIRGLKGVSELQGPLQASIWDQGDAVGAWIGDKIVAVVFPTPETLPQVRLTHWSQCVVRVYLFLYVCCLNTCGHMHQACTSLPRCSHTAVSASDLHRSTSMLLLS